MRFQFLGCLSWLVVVGPVSAQSNGGHTYHVVQQIPLGGDGRWDYVTLDTAGNRLFIAPNTLRTHVQNIMGKLRVHSKLEAVAFALRHRLVEPPRPEDSVTAR